VRNVANLVPPYAPDGSYHGVSAALEFGVDALRVKRIVVLGHARCGGVRAFAFSHRYFSLRSTVRAVGATVRHAHDVTDHHRLHRCGDDRAPAPATIDASGDTPNEPRLGRASMAAPPQQADLAGSDRTFSNVPKSRHHAGG